MTNESVKKTKNNLPGPGPGRPPGSPNKTTRLIKEAIIEAAERAGGKGGMVAYLQQQAKKTPGPFLALLGKLIPTEMIAAVASTNLTKEQRDAVAAAFKRADD